MVGTRPVAGPESAIWGGKPRAVPRRWTWRSIRSLSVVEVGRRGTIPWILSRIPDRTGGVAGVRVVVGSLVMPGL